MQSEVTHSIKEQPTLWINTTTSTNWTRAVVGVVRVEKELTTELTRLYPSGSVKQCVWSKDQFIQQQSLKQPAQMTSQGNQSADQTAVKTNSTPLLYPILPVRSALQAIAQGFLSLTPVRLRPFINKLMLSAQSFIKRNRHNRLMQGIKNLIKGRRYTLQNKTTAQKKSSLTNKLVCISAQQSIFKAGDILLSVGLDWDYPYTNEFLRLKTQEGVKIASCCYDLIPVLYPQYCVADVATHFSEYFLNLSDSSDIIFCISKQSEKDLKALLKQTGANEVQTHVFPLGDNLAKCDQGDLSQEIKALTATPFILFVSTIERRKNHQVLYQAYHLLCHQGRQKQLPKLVFVGMQGWGVNDLLKDIELDPLTKDLIIQLNHVSDSELHALYQAAICCVYPSLYEGWGLPVAEALALGKIVLSSDRASLPEVGGNLVTYIDPWNPQQWAENIWKVSTNTAYREKMTEQIKATYKPRLWKDAAQSIKQQLDQQLTDVFTPQILYPGYDFTTQTGRHIGAVISSRKSTGILMQGPYRALPAGIFHILIWDQGKKREAGLCHIRLKSRQGEIAQQNNIRFKKTAKKCPLAEFTIHLQQPIKEFTIQCELISGELSLEKMTINKIAKDTN